MNHKYMILKVKNNLLNKLVVYLFVTTSLFTKIT